MLVEEDVVVSLSGGAPWGFRLQGGAEHERPLQVAKVRRRSKACRAGLKEDDELVAIGDQTCTELSHSQAMNLIDMQSATLNLRVKRAPAFCVSSASPRVAGRGMLSPPVGGGVCITSPPDSEAYYGETDSDADIQTPALRRQRRTPPHPRSPARYESRDEEETTSEMSGYESAPDVGGFLHALWEPTRPLEGLPGVPRRELVYQPPEERTTDHSALLTPHTLTPRTLTPTQDQGLMEGEGEVDSGFQEAGSCVPLVSLERAKEAMMMGSSRQLVPMVGPQLGPISDELSTTYVDKAIQAKLHRGESVVEKQVKEARTKCRSIASLLTDAPNPNSKGVLMFKKRRQRAKKYTLTCFGKAEGEDTEGDTGGETEEEEGGSSALSGSEVEEEDFSASYDPTWDSGYLDLLDRMSSACPGTTPTTPTTPSTNHNPGLDASAYQSPGSEYTGYNGVAFQGPRLENGSAKQPIAAAPHSAPMSPHAAALTNGAPTVVSRASVVLTPAAQAPGAYQAGPQQQQHLHQQPAAYQHLHPAMNSEHHVLAAATPNANAAGVLNRTARPFGSGPGAARAPVAPVAFRPPQPRPAAAASVAAATRPVTAVSAVTIQPQRPLPGPEARRAVSTTSLYISPRGNGGNNNGTFPPPRLSPTSPPSPLASAQPPAQPVPFSPHYSGPPAAFPPPSSPYSPASAAPPLGQAPAQGPPSCQSASQPFSHPSPPHSQPFSHPLSHPSPPQAQPFSHPLSHPSPPQAQPYSHPLFHPSPPQPQPYSHPSPPHSQPFSHPSPPHSQPFSHPSPHSQPFSHPSPHSQPFSHPSPPHPQPFSPTHSSQSFPSPNGPAHLPSFSGISGSPPPPTPPHPAAPTQLAFQPQTNGSPAHPPPSTSTHHPPPPQPFSPYINVTGGPVTHPAPVAAMATAGSPPPPPPPQADSLASREQRISVPAARTGILQDARRRANNRPMFCAVQNKDVSPNPALLSMLQNMDSPAGSGPGQGAPGGDAGGHESGPEEDWLRLGAEACNFMQAQRGPRPPPVAPKPQAPQVPQMAQMEGKGGQLFARRQSRMDRYVVDRSPSVAAAPFSPGQPREASPTPSLPAAWKYSSSIRAPPPISYNPLLSPSCPLKAQKPQKAQAGRAGQKTGSKAAAKKGGLKPLEIMTHQPYQLNPSLFTYVPGAPQMTSSPQRPPQQQQRGVMGGYQTPMQTARVREVKRFSTPPPVATGPSLKVLVPRSVTSLGEPTWRSEPAFSYQPAPGHPQPQPGSPACYYPQPSQWASPSPLSPPAPPAPSAPLPQLPHLTSVHQGAPMHIPTFSHRQGSGSEQANRQFVSVPDLSPTNGYRPSSRSSQSSAGGPRPRFSTSNLGLQPCVWRPGAAMH